MTVGNLTLVRRAWPALLCLLLAAGCEPCAGVLSCGDPELQYRGRLIERHSGNPLSGALVEFAPSAGVTLAGPVTARTDEEGRFELSGETTAPGQLSGAVRILFDDGTVVDSLSDLRLGTTRGGDFRNLGEFPVLWPHFEAYGQLYQRATKQVAGGVEVEFRRTGGAEVDPDTFIVTSDPFGNFPLRPRPTRATGDVVGELIIRPPAPLTPDTVRGVRFSPRLERDPDPLVGRWGVGPVLPYVGRVIWPDGSPVVGVEVVFQRTGGIRVEPDRYVTTTVDWGGFHLGPAPLEAGELEFTLTFRPPAPAPETTYPFTLTTTEDDSRVILVETWTIPR